MMCDRCQSDATLRRRDGSMACDEHLERHEPPSPSGRPSAAAQRKKRRADDERKRWTHADALAALRTMGEGA